jgi:imidazolonepropionase
MRHLAILEDAAVLCAGGRIVSVGTRTQARRDAWLKRAGKHVCEVDCGQGVMLPGWVDAHTHPAFVKPRLEDFARRAEGAGYGQIARSGGGILSSVEAVRRSSPTALASCVAQALESMAACGTTTVEAKSGYGLSVQAELQSLQAISKAAQMWPGTVAGTLLAAHVVPPEYRGRVDRYVDLICAELLPAAARQGWAQFVDVFIERGAFTLEQGKRIARKAMRYGLGMRAHVCQFRHTPLASLLMLKPASLDHLDHASPADIRALARSTTVAVLLPASNYFLGLDSYPPARRWVDAGVMVALATDYNPGTSPTPSMPMVLSLACTQMRMTPEEAITAATLNGAWSLGLGERKGSIEPGKDADLALFRVRDYREIPYWFGVNLCAGVCLNGHWRERLGA